MGPPLGVMDLQLLAFLGMSAVVIATPGQDTALTIRNTLLGGRAAGVATAFGVALGQAAWTIGASLGLTAILLASEAAFSAVRLVGAAYLVFLGAHAIWGAIQPGAQSGPATTAPPRLDRGRALRQGLFSNLGNPKMAIFFSSLLPQFVPAGSTAFGSMLGLGLVFVSMTFGWLCLYAAVVARFGDLLRRPRIRRVFDAAMGAILIAFGVRLAAERP
jgi:threonine/homoserine/homoserine lactone efflux protein